MKPIRLAFCLAIAAVALCGLAALVAAPAAASGWSVAYSGSVDNGSTVTYNNCFITFNLANGSAHITFSAQGYQIETQNLSPGNYYDYNEVVQVYVAQINTTDKAWVSISVPTSSQVTPTPVPAGTKVVCLTPGVEALAGDTVSFQIQIQNNNNADHTYTLSASGVSGWGYQFVSGSASIYKVYVPQGQTATVTLQVATTGNTGVGEKTINVNVDSQAIPLYVDITSVNQTASVSFDVTSKIGAVGDAIDFSVKITNLQSKQNTYLLSASGLPDNWYYSYKTTAGSSEALAEVVIPAGGSQSLVLEVVPPYSVTAGSYNLTATVTTPDGVGIDNNLSIRLTSSADMDMASSKLGYDAKAGQTFEIDVYVTNTGSGAALTNVHLEPDAPSGWTVQVTPNRTNSLAAGSTQTFKMMVTPPGNIVPSDYDIDVQAVSDQAMKEKDFRITITVDSIVPYVGGAIILLVIVGLVLVYRKYGRR